MSISESHLAFTPQVYRNDELGLEAIINEGNVNHPYRVICRDFEADKTIFVFFGTLAVCYDNAMAFTENGRQV